MTDRDTIASEANQNDARAPWSDPTCTEYAVEELTQAGGPGITDAGILS